MATPTQPETLSLLTNARRGDAGCASRLLPLVYDELRALAARFLQSERPGHTLEPTALVHEAYARLVGDAAIDWRDRTHFFRTAAQAMRRVLVDHARARAAMKRGGDSQRITLDEQVAVSSDRQVDLLALDEALEKLTTLHDRHRQVIELRFFGGLTIAEVAETLDVSTTTVEDDWAMARAWLRRELMPQEP